MNVNPVCGGGASLASATPQLNSIAGILSRKADPALVPLMQQMLDGGRRAPAQVAEQCALNHLGVRLGQVRPRSPEANGTLVWSKRHYVGVLLAGEDLSLDRQSNADAAALANAWEQSGEAMLSTLDGWFTGVVIDVRHDSVALFNDPHGLGRIYYHEAVEGFFFSSEPRSILTVLPQLLPVERHGAARMNVAGVRSLYSELSTFPPGAVWTFRHDGRIEQRCFSKNGEPRFPTNW